ncbi:hypothetical protein [Rhodoplanes roseus]|uniref:Uncharacterized protein n=1 Tax=Rhodoplanes roseus TaxID=29409 RepID=A0A327KXE8_9BRAD|nr:hypothetical protein [Rhodoplanes roseus]RAI42807.1 hypothetical protein CH341_17590 [Rhodoplanes roseus]
MKATRRRVADPAARPIAPIEGAPFGIYMSFPPRRDARGQFAPYPVPDDGRPVAITLPLVRALWPAGEPIPSPTVVVRL